MYILELPAELLSEILAYLRPADIVHFGQTSRRSSLFVDPNNALLWQSAFLQVFDDPFQTSLSLSGALSSQSEKIPSPQKWDWHAQTRRRLSALKAISSEWTDEFLDRAPAQEETIQSILDIIDGALPDSSESLNLSVLPMRTDMSIKFDRLIRGSYEDNSAWYSSRRPVTRSMACATGRRSDNASRLHVLFGVTEPEEKDARALGLARCIVYERDRTNEANDWGLFLEDGSGDVDWLRLEAAASVATTHFTRAMHSKVLLPQGFRHSVPHPRPKEEKDLKDWAGATGSWVGTYVFLNYEDFLAYNTVNPAPSLEDGPESCGGLGKLELALDETIKDDAVLQPSLPYCKDLPPLYFSGFSANYESRQVILARGMACLCPNGREVRWKFIVSYNGADQWQLEGVQPGGIKSGCIYGLWTSCAHEENSPVGPFVYGPASQCRISLS